MTAQAALAPDLPQPTGMVGLLDAPVTVGPDGPVLAGPAADLATHHARYGSAGGLGGGALLAALETAGLTGRGGAHFPVAAKWRAALGAGGGGLVVANLAEGEPLSAKDAVLAQRQPHLVLDGLALAAATTGAVAAVAWLHAGAVGTRAALEAALAQRHAAGVRELPVHLVEGPDAYLSGESSAVVAALAGLPALPQFRRTPAAVAGVGGRPTVVHNAESLARVALLARTGAAGYRSTTLLTLAGPRARTVVEVDAGQPFAALAGLLGGWPVAVLLGGYGGRWVAADRLALLAMDHAALRTAGLSLGAGVVAPLPPGACGLAETAAVAQYLAASGAGQCGPCLFGLPAIARALRALADGTASAGEVDRLRTHLGEVAGRGACHHPDASVSLVSSALTLFGDDVAAHRAGRPCGGASRAPGLLPASARAGAA